MRLDCESRLLVEAWQNVWRILLPAQVIYKRPFVEETCAVPFTDWPTVKWANPAYIDCAAYDILRA